MRSCLLLVAAGLVAFSQPVSAQPSDNLALSTAALPNLPDFTVATERAVCSGGRSAAVADRLLQENAGLGRTIPDPAIHCPAVLREVARRGRLLDLYSFVAGQGGDGVHEHGLILSAALQDEASYVAVGGDVRALNCELAFDAGFYFGAFNAEQPIAVGIADSTLARVADTCFREGKSSNRIAAVAGMRAGQAFSRQP